MRLSGWFGLPTYARGQADQQHFFLNGRPLRDKLVASAVRLAYRDVLFHGRQPAYVLYLEIDPSRVDVNAHPQKLEVRFREPGLVHDFLFRTLERALAQTRAATQGGAQSIPAARLRVAGAGRRPVQTGWSALDLYGSRPGAAARTRCDTPVHGRPAPPLPASIEGAAATDAADHPLGYAIAQLHGVYILAQAPRRTGARRHARRARAHGVRAAQGAPCRRIAWRASRC